MRLSHSVEALITIASLSFFSSLFSMHLRTFTLHLDSIFCRVTPQGKPPVYGNSPAKAWMALFSSSKANDATIVRSSIAGAGNRMFGLTSPPIQEAIQALPGAEKCERYCWPDVHSNALDTSGGGGVADIWSQYNATTRDVMKHLRIAAEAQRCQLPHHVSGLSAPCPQHPGACHVCFEEEEDDEDLLLQCDACKIFVHMLCYGVKDRPVGDQPWLCDICKLGRAIIISKQQLGPGKNHGKNKAGGCKSIGCRLISPTLSGQETTTALRRKGTLGKAIESCSVSNENCESETAEAVSPEDNCNLQLAMTTAEILGPWRYPACALCPAQGGVLKRTTCGRWAHLACALWLPETALDPSCSYLDMSGLIKGVDDVHASRMRLPCQICKQQYGACIQCCHPSCYFAFHLSCALGEGYATIMQQEDGWEQEESEGADKNDNDAQSNKEVDYEIGVSGNGDAALESAKCMARGEGGGESQDHISKCKTNERTKSQQAKAKALQEMSVSDGLNPANFEKMEPKVGVKLNCAVDVTVGGKSCRGRQRKQKSRSVLTHRSNRHDTEDLRPDAACHHPVPKEPDENVIEFDCMTSPKGSSHRFHHVLPNGTMNPTTNLHDEHSAITNNLLTSKAVKDRKNEQGTLVGGIRLLIYCPKHGGAAHSGQVKDRALISNESAPMHPKAKKVGGKYQKHTDKGSSGDGHVVDQGGQSSRDPVSLAVARAGAMSPMRSLLGVEGTDTAETRASNPWNCARAVPLGDMLAKRRGQRAPEALQAVYEKRFCVVPKPLLVTCRPSQRADSFSDTTTNVLHNRIMNREAQYYLRETKNHVPCHLHRPDTGRKLVRRSDGMPQDSLTAWNSLIECDAPLVPFSPAIRNDKARSLDDGRATSSKHAQPETPEAKTNERRSRIHPGSCQHAKQDLVRTIYVDESKLANILSSSQRFAFMKSTELQRVTPGKSGIHGWGAFARTGHCKGVCFCTIRARTCMKQNDPLMTRAVVEILPLCFP